MKKTAFFGVILGLGFLVSSFVSSVNEETEELTWYTSLEEAHELSKEQGKPIFGFFTGSDWCGWCIRLQKDVFAKPDFITWANENVILLELDFPKRTAQSDELKQQNRDLQAAFGVRGYPTIWIFNSEKDESTGKMNLSALGKLGYMKNETVFIKEANKILGKEK